MFCVIALLLSNTYHNKQKRTHLSFPLGCSECSVEFRRLPGWNASSFCVGPVRPQKVSLREPDKNLDKNQALGLVKTEGRAKLSGLRRAWGAALEIYHSSEHRPQRGL